MLKVEPRAHLHHTYCPFMFSASSATHLPYLIFLSSSADANEAPFLGGSHLLRGLGASRRGNIQLSRGTTVLPLVAALILLTLPVSSGSTSTHVAQFGFPITSGTTAVQLQAQEPSEGPSQAPQQPSDRPRCSVGGSAEADKVTAGSCPGH